MDPVAAGTQVAASTAAGAAVCSSWRAAHGRLTRKHFQTAAGSLRALLEDRAL
jgi:hypothetical protein